MSNLLFHGVTPRVLTHQHGGHVWVHRGAGDALEQSVGEVKNTS